MTKQRKGGRNKGSKNINWEVIGPVVLSLIGHTKINDISKRIGVSNATLNAWLNREFAHSLQRKMGRPTLLTENQKARIRFLRKSDVSIKEIARLYDVSIHTIYRVLKEHENIKVPRK